MLSMANTLAANTYFLYAERSIFVLYALVVAAPETGRISLHAYSVMGCSRPFRPEQRSKVVGLQYSISKEGPVL